MFDETTFDQQYKVYDQVRNDLGLTAIWSIYEVADLSKPHTYSGAKYVSYKDHWGKGIVTQAINGNTWADLYVAADRCIRDSGDVHHVFIEDFRKSGNTLLLTTGS